MTNPTDRVEVPCPQCAESILREAKKCKHCGAWVSEGTSKPPVATAPPAPASTRPTLPRAADPIGPMGLDQAVRSCFSKYATFDGRARRAEYWYWQLGSWIALFGMTFISIVLFGAGSSTQVAFYWGSVLVMLVPSSAVLVRRLHDTNHSGWWVWVSLTIIGAIPLLIWLCEEGTQGDNDYGPRTT